jgi:glycosyltransferase involved in cell wall biosynthesis
MPNPASDFRIHSICLVKNEADIIQACLRDALRWADYIYVYDNGSTDGTWEIVRAMESAQIVAWKSEDQPFQDTLRSEVFNAFRHRVRPGDWWGQLDADEFYLDNPREFLAAVPQSAQVVWSAFIEYYLTQRDLETLDFSQPVETILGQLRYYRADQSESRFFRHRDRLAWPRSSSHPIHMGVVYPKRIRLRHYKYRSPEQIQLRLDTRRDARRRGFRGWDHAAQESWREKIDDAARLHYDDGTSPPVIDEKNLPDHLGSWKTRVVKRVMHGLGIWP